MESRSTFFVITCGDPFTVFSGDYSGTSKSGCLRLHASMS